MPGAERNYNSDKYRYGFNGKEKDQNLEFGSQTVYDYGFRIYNPAIGKFLSVDPLTKQFPWYTPYQFAGNSPIVSIDLDGLEDVFYDEIKPSSIPLTELPNQRVVSFLRPIGEQKAAGLDAAPSSGPLYVLNPEKRFISRQEVYRAQNERHNAEINRRAKAAEGNRALAMHKARSSNFIATFNDVVVREGTDIINAFGTGRYEDGFVQAAFFFIPGKLDNAARKVAVQIGEARGTLQRTKRGFDGNVTYNGKKVDFDATVSGTKDDLIIDDIGIFVENNLGTNYLGAEGKNVLGRGFPADLRGGIESQLAKEGVTKVTYKFQRVLYDKKTRKPTGKTEQRSVTRKYQKGSWKTQPEG